MNVEQVRKALMAVTATLAAVVATGVLSGAALDTVNVVAAVVTALGAGVAVWATPNVVPSGDV